MEYSSYFILLVFTTANFLNGANSLPASQEQATLIINLLRSLDTKITALDGKVVAVDRKQTELATAVSQGFNNSQSQCTTSSNPVFSQVIPAGVFGSISAGKLKLKVSGRKFPDLDTGLGTTDPYFELFISQDGGQTQTKLLRSDVVSDKEDPDWGQTIEVEFNRAQNQWLLFNVWDSDNLRDDDRVGSVWINLADYVDKGQSKIALLDKIDYGYLIITAADRPVSPISPGNINTSSTPKSKTPSSSSVVPQSVKFKLSASGLPTKDDIGFVPGNSDPYVIVYVKEGLNGKETEIGRSGTVASTRTPTWGDVFTFQWVKNKDQRLSFRIYDEDNLREDSKLGVAWIEPEELVGKGNAFTVPLVKKGTITITKV